MSDNTETGKYRLNIGGLSITSESLFVVLSEPIKSPEEMSQLWIRISKDISSYSRMGYTTDIDTLKLIFENMTLRSSSLSNANLNDRMEKQRVGVSQFAGGRFITCFSHKGHESIPFWAYYGGKEKANKVQLQFKNFADSFQDCIYTDYALGEDGKKVFFYSDEYKDTLKHNCVLGQMGDLPQINTDYDITTCVRSIAMFDVEYVPADSSVFTNDYSGTSNINIGHMLRNDNGEKAVLENMKLYQPDCLGKQKSNPWDYECETRILSVLNNQDFSGWGFIDLRLKEAMFKDLVVIMNPWNDDNLEQKIRAIIDSSSLGADIKKSIQIVHSVVEGTLNL